MPSLKSMLPHSGQMLYYEYCLESLGLSILDQSWAFFGETLDLLRKDIQILISTLKITLKEKQTVGELCDRTEIGWTCCIICCELNTGNKRTLVQQKTETLDLFYKQFI